ncbi:NACHT-domain-containing protein [Penicillium cataractarum]|uniref:NACHT-domain-containing protein n=1 Tax=Penicillium cataractarum TaxID=2100454 RepID=A0A9X0B6H5_9EURO|nr:NACHT-domain-containing protein [Penicillium cataractarum]KAJ5389886.1 NACHT-domain-containing protein [Penicillium cataractarum]
MGGLKSRLKRFVGGTSAEHKTSSIIGNGDTTGSFVIENNKENDTTKLDITDKVVQLSLADTSSSSPGPTENSGAENTQVAIHSPAQGSVSLWDIAYDSLREDRRDLIVAYEDILSRAFMTGRPQQTSNQLIKLADDEYKVEKDAPSIADANHLENQIPQHDAIARREMLKKITELGLKHMKDKEVTVTVFGLDIGLKDTLVSVAGAVEWAEDYVKAAVKDLPYASVVMAGVSLILPLLKNPVAIEAANREGFTYITSQMRCYVEMESLRLPADMAAGLKSSLTDGVTGLYKLIIEFQVESVIRFYRSRTKNYFRDTVNYDDWSQKLSQIKETETSLDKLFERVISGESLQQLKNLAREAKDSRKSLDDMLRKFDELIDISRDQKTIMEKNEQRLSHEDNRRCQEALQATDPVLDKERILLKKDRLLRDSYCWVLENNEFQEWRNDVAGQLLWLTGDPGKGKTMLICGIIDELSKPHETAQDGNICYFFCQATDDRINSAVAVLRGLIYMLVREQPLLMKHLRESCNDKSARHFEGPNAWVALSKVFIDMLEDSELQNTYLIVDALDECRADLDLLLQFMVEKSSAYSKVKWITSSRNWPNIEKGLKSTQKRRLCIELNEESVSGAVDSYIQSKINWLAQRNEYDEETREAVQQYLLANANGTFLWVALVCKELANISGWEAEELLTVFPPGLDDLYERMLGQIRSSRHATLCRSILAVILFVHRPITLDELTSLVEMPPRVSGNLKALEEIVGLCGSFLTLQKHTVSFVHQSAKDFLLDKASADIFPDGDEDLHYKIFLRSLQTMANTLRRDIYALGTPGYCIEELSQPDPDPLAPARYACVFWVDHLQDCGPKKRAKDDLHEGGIVDRFLKRDFLHWLESLCLLEALPEGVVSMLSLEALVQVSARRLS